MKVATYIPSSKSFNGPAVSSPTPEGVPASPRVLFFPGFPGIRSRQNREIAQGVADLAGLRCDVALYDGLGHAPGQFSFESCLADVLNSMKELRQSGLQDVFLVGHSWGGYLSLAISSENHGWVRGLVLMSPLLHMLPSDVTVPYFEDHQRTNPEISTVPARELGREFERLQDTRPSGSFIRKLARDLPVLFLQSKDDTITPAKYALEAKSDFPKSIDLRLVDNDHSFLSDRPELARQIARQIEEWRRP